MILEIFIIIFLIKYIGANTQLLFGCLSSINDYLNLLFFSFPKNFIFIKFFYYTNDFLVSKNINANYISLIHFSCVYAIFINIRYYGFSFIGFIFGSYWAYTSLSWGFIWNNDIIEIVVLFIVLFILILKYHKIDKLISPNINAEICIIIIVFFIFIRIGFSIHSIKILSISNFYTPFIFYIIFLFLFTYYTMTKYEKNDIFYSKNNLFLILPSPIYGNSITFILIPNLFIYYKDLNKDNNDTDDPNDFDDLDNFKIISHFVPIIWFICILLFPNIHIYF